MSRAPKTAVGNAMWTSDEPFKGHWFHEAACFLNFPNEPACTCWLPAAIAAVERTAVADFLHEMKAMQDRQLGCPLCGRSLGAGWEYPDLGSHVYGRNPAAK